MPEGPQGQVGAVGGHRRQYGVQPGAVGQPGVRVRGAVVESPPGAGDQPLRKPADVLNRAHRDRDLVQPRSPVDPDAHAVHQNVGDLRVGQQWGQRPGTDEVVVYPVGDP